MLLVGSRVETQLAARQEVQLRGPPGRDFRRPFVDRGTFQPESPGGGGLRTVMLDDIGLEHTPRAYPMRYAVVNDGIRSPERPSQPMETMGDRIKNLLVIRNMAQAELARRVGVTRAAVQKWISGDTANMGNATLLLVAKELGTDPAYLVWGEDRKPSAPPSPPAPPAGDTGETGRFKVGRRR